MKRPKAKDITESYRKFRLKKRDPIRNRLIEKVCLELLCSAQDKKNN